MKTIPLIKYEKPHLTRGCILRFFTKDFDDESVVDYIVFDPQNTDRGMSLMTVTGYHAGLIYVSFPIESYSDEMKAISTKWLIKNWNKWVCPECNIENVYITKYPDPIIKGVRLD